MVLGRNGIIINPTTGMPRFIGYGHLLYFTLHYKRHSSNSIANWRGDLLLKTTLIKEHFVVWMIIRSLFWKAAKQSILISFRIHHRVYHLPLLSASFICTWLGPTTKSPSSLLSSCCRPTLNKRGSLIFKKAWTTTLASPLAWHGSKNINETTTFEHVMRHDFLWVAVHQSTFWNSV